MSKKFEVRPEYRDDELIFAAVEAARDFEGLVDANQYFARLCESELGFVELANNASLFSCFAALLPLNSHSFSGRSDCSTA